MSDTSPPSSHAAHIQPALPTMPATSAGDLKMPAPMTTPMISVKACRRPRTARGPSSGELMESVLCKLAKRRPCYRRNLEHVHELLAQVGEQAAFPEPWRGAQYKAAASCSQ